MVSYTLYPVSATYHTITYTPHMSTSHAPYEGTDHEDGDDYNYTSHSGDNGNECGSGQGTSVVISLHTSSTRTCKEITPAIQVIRAGYYNSSTLKKIYKQP